MHPCVLLAAYAAGIAMATQLPPIDRAAAAIAAGMLACCWLPLRRSPWSWLPVLALLAIAGLLNAASALAPPAAADDVARFVGDPDLALEGRILTAEERTDGSHRLQMAMLAAASAEGSARVSGELLLTIGGGELRARPGQVVRWRAPLRRPTRFGNPGEFDYPLHLAARGIHATTYLERAEDLAILADRPAPPSAAIEAWRRSLAEAIGQAVPASEAGLLQSLLLGMRGGVSDAQRRDLATGGIAHLFAISGLHFGLLALLLYQAGKVVCRRSTRLLLLCPPQRFLPILLIAPLGLYLLLTGSAWATRRAFLMVTATALLITAGRRTPPFALLATAALGLLLMEPLALFQPGFQLSFAGVAGILAWFRRWQAGLPIPHPALRLLLAMALTTTAATLATAPATLWHFHQVAPAGLVSNLIAIPLVAWGAVPIGLAGITLQSVAPHLAEFGLQLAAWLVSLAVELAVWVSAWPGLAPVEHYMTPAEMVLLTGALLAMLPLHKVPRPWLARLALVAAAVGLALLLQPEQSALRVTALSVGQGDATLVSLPGDRHYLVDAGGLPGSDFDTGERLVGPALGRMGINRLQGVVLTHAHPDHVAGMTYILRRFEIDDIYLAVGDEELPSPLRDALGASRARTHRLEGGWHGIVMEDARSLALFVPDQQASDANERSIAVYAGERGQGALLTADLGPAGLQQLLATDLPGPVTLLKLPHHGSRNSAPERFLESFAPQAAFVSAGPGNPYGFPHSQAIEACAGRGLRLYRTDQDGMLRFSLAGGSWHAETGPAL